jgi:hypothetical protein
MKISDFDKNNLGTISTQDEGKNKPIILKYLKNRDYLNYASTKRVYDVFQNAESNNYCQAGYSDGVYQWTSDEIYYFEKYNLKLYNDFITSVLQSTKKGDRIV